MSSPYPKFPQDNPSAVIVRVRSDTCRPTAKKIVDILGDFHFVEVKIENGSVMVCDLIVYSPKISFDDFHFGRDGIVLAKGVVLFEPNQALAILRGDGQLKNGRRNNLCCDKCWTNSGVTAKTHPFAFNQLEDVLMKCVACNNFWEIQRVRRPG